MLSLDAIRLLVSLGGRLERDLRSAILPAAAASDLIERVNVHTLPAGPKQCRDSAGQLAQELSRELGVPVGPGVPKGKGDRWAGCSSPAARTAAPIEARSPARAAGGDLSLRASSVSGASARIRRHDRFGSPTVAAQCRSCPGSGPAAVPHSPATRSNCSASTWRMTNPRRPRFLYLLSDGGWADTQAGVARICWLAEHDVPTIHLSIGIAPLSVECDSIHVITDPAQALDHIAADTIAALRARTRPRPVLVASAGPGQQAPGLLDRY